MSKRRDDAEGLVVIAVCVMLLAASVMLAVWAIKEASGR